MPVSVAAGDALVAGISPSGTFLFANVDALGNFIFTGTFTPGGTQDENLIQVGGAGITLGQKAMAASLPVVIASDQSTLPISAASLPLPAGASTSALQTTGNTSLASILAQLDVALSTRASQATLASILTQLDVALSTRASQTTLASVLTQLDVALSTRASQTTLASVLTQLDVALSTRLADVTFTTRINTLGQKAMAASTPIVIASDQSAIPVTATLTAGGLVSTKTDLTPSAPTFATVGVASAQAVAAAATRKGLTLINTSGATISLGFGSAAVLNSGVTLLPNGVFVMDEYSFDIGAVNAIASAAASNLAVQEYVT